jgi:hypothetical protein
MKDARYSHVRLQHRPVGMAVDLWPYRNDTMWMKTVPLVTHVIGAGAVFIIRRPTGETENEPKIESAPPEMSCRSQSALFKQSKENG